MKQVTVVGAGFAGLTLAYHLHKLGFETVIYEKQERAGGLIDTVVTPFGQAETAANALLADKNVEDLFVDLGVEFAERTGNLKKRYIFWDKPRRWPLSAASSWRLIRAGFKYLVRNDHSLMPEDGESIHDWARRAVDGEFAERLVEPALQGIYAGDPRAMSAGLILKGMSQNRPPRGYYKGSIAPVEGMGALIRGLQDYLEEHGALFQFKTPFKMPDYITQPIVIATSAWAAAEILQASQPAIAKTLARCESLSLVRSVCFFDKTGHELEGFGCLFPVRERFHNLGALFDSSIFPNRSALRSESWIMGGAAYPEITAWSDEQVIESIVRDRERLTGRRQEPVGYHITRWPRAIPHYTVEWERALQSLQVPPPLYLHGNYLGQLGLSRILNRSISLAAQIKENYG